MPLQECDARHVYKRISLTQEMRDHYLRLSVQCKALGLPSLSATFNDLVEAWDREMYE